MRQSNFLIGLCLLLFSCNAQTQHDLKIPNQVSTTKNSSSQQFPGTRIFVDKPQGYELIKQLVRFQKNESTYFQIIESPVTNFDNQKTAIIKAFDDAVSSGKLPKEYYKKEFKLDEYNAILYYGADSKPNQEQIVLCFGDKDFGVLAAGEIPANNEQARDEVLKALLSLYVDKNIKADPTALANYSLDISNSEFKYEGNVSQTYYYTVGGKGDPANNPYENQIMVMTLPAMNSNEDLKNYALDMINRYKQNGMEIPSFEQKEITLNGNYAYEISFKGSFKDKPNSVYQIVTGNNKAAILFLGGVYDRQDELMPQIKNIAKTLKTK